MVFPKICIIAASLVVATHTEARAGDVTYRVALRVDGRDTVSSEVSSYLSRGLRGLGDVTITDTEPFFRVHVIALPITTGGSNAGFALSVIVTQATAYDTLRPFLKHTTDETSLRALDGVLKDSVNLIDHFVRVCGDDELEKTCRAMVAEIEARRWSQIGRQVKGSRIGHRSDVVV